MRARCKTWMATAVCLLAMVGCPDPVEPNGSVDGDGGSTVFVFFDAGRSPVSSDAGPSPSDGGAAQPVSDAGPVASGNVGLDSVSPSTGVLNGGYRVRLGGFGFTPDTRVFFGGVEADQVLYLTEFAVTCRVPAGAAPGPVEVRIESPLGAARADNLFTYFSPVTLTALEPAMGSTRGGTIVTLQGETLSDDMIVLVGGRQAVSVQANEAGTEATFVTPPGESGRVDVIALDAFGASTLRLAFTYRSALELQTVSPPSFEVGTPGLVDLWGAGFDETTSVRIGGQVASLNNLISEERLRVVLPPQLPIGLHDVVVQRADEIASLEGRLLVRPVAQTGAFALHGAVPARGDVAGGTEIELFGDGLSDVTRVEVGSVEATNFQVVDDRSLRLVLPPGQVGPATLHVVNQAGDRVSWSGFAYEASLALTAFEPAWGPAEGGTAFVLQGRSFDAQMDVWVGGTRVADLSVVSSTEATGTTPPGSSGYVPVEVKRGNERALLENAFLYRADLQALGAFPVRGGMGGGTYVVVRGQGFTVTRENLTATSDAGASDPGIEVFFGEAAASDVEVLSDNLIAVRTPPGPPGVVDIRVRNGEGEGIASRAFTYFDPTFLLGGTRGGPVDGALYVTALDAFMGMPVPDLACFLGRDGATPYIAKTDMLGQCTLSGPDLRGPQTVTVAGEGWEYATLVDVNASEITVYLQPTTLAGNPGGGSPPPLPPPATIRGRVTGFAKEFFDPAALTPQEMAIAVVVTTARDEFSGTPDPGGENVVFQEGGEYFIANARPGRVALVALAGIYNLSTSEFRLRQMGVRRNVYPQLGVNLLEQDIELNIPLDQSVELSLPDAPVRAPGETGDGPTITRVVPFLRFGGEGALAYTDAVNATRNHDLETMPDLPGEMLTFIAGAYTTDGAGLVTDSGTINLVAGDPFATGSGTSWGLTDFFGRPLVQGQILVVERPGEPAWATTVINALNDSRILLARRPPFSGTGLRYHIGSPSYPSSEVVQDGNGDLVGGVTIQPVLGLPEPLSPEENGVMTHRTLRWKAAPGQQPSTHMHYLIQYDDWFGGGDLNVLWTFYIDGARTKVPVPKIPDALETLGLEGMPNDLLPGGVAWQHMTIYSPGFDYENFSYVDIGSRGRRAWTTDVHFFVYPGETADQIE